MASIVLDGISKVFRHGREQIEALKNLHLEVPHGELLTIVGPSGSGKTTLLRLIAGLDSPSHGDIRINGNSTNGVPPHQRDIAMVFQSGALFPHITVRDNISLGLKLRKIPPLERDNRIKEAIDCMHLESCLSRFPPDLSTGQRQRVALARAMVRRPAIFLLDEPLANLDPPMRAELRAEIARLRSRLNATMIYVTHDQAEALSLGDRVAVLRGGKLEQVAEPAIVYARPANTFVARFIGSPPMNLIAGTFVRDGDALVFKETTDSDAGLRIKIGLLQAKYLQSFPPTLSPTSSGGRPLGPLSETLSGGRALAPLSVTLGVRPDDVAITSGQAHPERGQPVPVSGSAHRDSIEVPVERVEHTGSDVYVQVRTAAHTLIARASQRMDLKPGSLVSIQLQPEALHFFDAQTGLRLNQ